MDVRIRSKLTAQELFHRIGDGIDPPDFAWSRSGFIGRIAFVGRMSWDGSLYFLLFRRRAATAYVGPCQVTSFFYGEVRSYEGGSEVLGRLTVYPFAKLLVALLFFAALAGSAVCAWSVATIPDCSPQAGWAVSVGCAVVGSAMLALRWRFASVDGPVIGKYLEECAGDESRPYR
jgi:hypothetical protein